MANIQHEDDERAKRGAFWSRMAVTLLSLRASLDKRVEAELESSGPTESQGPDGRGNHSNGNSGEETRGKDEPRM
jgi:hypothetical protein